MSSAARGSESPASVAIDDELLGDAPVRWLTLRRAEENNPLDAQTVSELLAATADAVQQGMRGLVITGCGRAFSAGGDLKGYQKLYRDEVAFGRFLAEFAELCDLLETSSLATVALINGTCLAGGLELALAADVIIVDEDAIIGDGHLRFGQLPGAGGSQRLCRAIGGAAAKAWLLSGHTYTGRDAARLGLAAEAVSGDELRACAKRWLGDLCEHSELAYRQMKSLIRAVGEMPRTEALDFERSLVIEYVTTTHDATEGLLAFAERRRPRFRGR